MARIDDEDPAAFNAFLLVEPNRATQCKEVCRAVTIREGQQATCMRPHDHHLHLEDVDGVSAREHLLVSDAGDALFWGGRLVPGRVAMVPAHHRLGTQIEDVAALWPDDVVRPECWPLPPAEDAS